MHALDWAHCYDMAYGIRMVSQGILPEVLFVVVAGALSDMLNTLPCPSFAFPFSLPCPSFSLDGTHLGHNLPDSKGNRYCINLVSVAGYPPDSSEGESQLSAIGWGAGKASTST